MYIFPLKTLDLCTGFFLVMDIVKENEIASGLLALKY
jgi:hypothetical protein